MKYQDKSKNTFEDLDRKFYTEALLKVNSAGVINSSGGKIRPRDKATREEVADMLDNCIEALYSKEGTYSDITIDGNIIINNPAVALKNSFKIQ